MNAGDGGPGPSNGASTSVTLVNSSSRSRVDAPQWEENRSHSIRIDALDLGRDYSVDKEPTASVKKQNKWRPLSPGKIKKTKEEEKASERGPRNKKWVNDEDEPMTDVKKLPKGWTMEEPDLDPDDISAQINRAKERIADDIMPFAFKWKLEYYRRIRRNQRRIKSRWPDTLSWQVVQRLESLRKIRRDLLQEDVYEQLPNVDAIIDRYTTGRLNWTGLVTYWHRGEQISQPRPFNWVEFEVINDHHNGKNGFWVEGVRIVPLSQHCSLQLDWKFTWLIFAILALSSMDPNRKPK
ncbi:hypothetical protein N7456_000204 [Penicillium angulare]|uniref:Uncharacterized protein n=1 Tax=Penicillium angulare TaxID=116970 RepID=A0A9W9GBN8_9EURO|nr:hypothetical protein N7456_000204 [Penicillium angulare]